MSHGATDRAIFAAGCFWGVQDYFDKVPGVVKTTAGYTGGHTERPTYVQVCSHTTGHAEAVEITFDPELVIQGLKADAGQGGGEKRTEPYDGTTKGASEPSTQHRAASSGGAAGSASRQAAAFEYLVRHFFRMHDPTQVNRQGPDIGDNYRSAIFYTTEGQKATAEKVVKELTDREQFNKPIATEITKAGKFWPAEEYHQKYTAKTGFGGCHIPYTQIGV
jgi:peptide methionine sulfoxide reductase msrA/msrB